MRFETKILTSNDWKILREIRLDTLKSEPQAFSTKYTDEMKKHDSYWIDKLQDENDIYIVAIVDNNTVGVVRASFKDSDAPSDTGVIGSLYVKKAFRGVGIAKKLIKNSIKHLESNRNINRIWLWVRSSQKIAVNLYKKLGFSLVKEVNDELEGKIFTEYIMERVISVGKN